MASNVAIAAGKSNLALTKSGVTAPDLGGIQSLTVEFLKKYFPQDTYKRVERFFNFSSAKTAENRMTGARGFNEDEVAAIICSQLGGQYIKALMEALPNEARPDWYVILEPLLELADAQKLLLVARSKTAKAIRRTVDAESQLSVAIDRAQTISVQDPEFASATLDALGAMARPLYRAVAQAKGRKK